MTVDKLLKEYEENGYVVISPGVIWTPERETAMMGECISCQQWLPGIRCTKCPKWERKVKREK